MVDEKLSAGASLRDRAGRPADQAPPGLGESATIPSAAWRPFKSAPRDKPFFALNHDGEIWVARYIDGERLAFRDHKMVETRRWTARKIDGEEWRREDTSWEHHADEWQDRWTFWTRGYEFKPTMWLELPRPHASAIDARSDATGTGAAEGESAVAKPDAQPSGATS